MRFTGYILFFVLLLGGAGFAQELPIEGDLDCEDIYERCLTFCEKEAYPEDYTLECCISDCALDSDWCYRLP